MFLEREIQNDKFYDIGDTVYIVIIKSDSKAVAVPDFKGDFLWLQTNQRVSMTIKDEYSFKVIPIKIEGKVKAHYNNQEYSYYYWDSLNESMSSIHSSFVFDNVEDAKTNIENYIKEYNISDCKIIIV